MDADPASATSLRTERSARLGLCLARAQAGDLTALDEVVDELNPLLWHVARAEGLTREDAADVVQTIWLELVRSVRSIRSPHALTAWLVRATKREAWHSGARRRKWVGPGADHLEEKPDDAPGPEDRVGAQERHQVLLRHFARLSERCRALLRVVAHGGKPDYAAIAAALGMPHGSIGPTRGRCLAKLREMLLADPLWSAE